MGLVALPLCFLLAFVGVKLGLRLLLFTSVGCSALTLFIVALALFITPLTKMLNPWIASSVAQPVLLVCLGFLLFRTGYHLIQGIEEALGELPEPADRTLGGFLGLVIGLALAQLIS
ncbi:MAG: hypothetical protein ABIG67_02805 [Pseudomonadota bacterium]